MAEGKWISDLTPTTPLAEAARKALGVRLAVVGDYLDLALREPYRDVEHVHQLRVGTRRAVAALEIFASCLPAKVYRKARKRLRRLRRAAGQARDWDVFLADCAARELRRDRPRRGLDFLLGYAWGHRVAAQADLEATGAPLVCGFEALRAEIVAAVREPGADGRLPTLLDLARPMLLDFLREFQGAAAADLDDYEHLHQVRILGKRLRYAMEVFADCFAPAFRETIYPEVEEMQDILGRANDSHVACLRLAVLRAGLRQARPSEWKVFKPDIDGLLRYHQRRLPQGRRRFLQWWQHWQARKMDSELIGLLKDAASVP